MGRFINADNYPSTGQGLTGNNMFAYCGNNPVNRLDPGGHLWLEIGIGIGVALTTGIANGISSETSGGNFAAGFWVGVAAGAVGYGLSFATKNPLGLVSIRSITSLGSDILTAYANNGSVSRDDIATSAVDAIMDGLFSCISYYYNPFTDNTALHSILGNMLNAGLDGLTDVAETWLFAKKPTQNSNMGKNIPNYSSGPQMVCLD